MNITAKPEDAVEIVKEAFTYGWPMIENYNTLDAYTLDDDKENPNYKAGFNKLANEGQVYTWEDDAVVTPNSDTPYSFLWGDLRAEPLVIKAPPIPEPGQDDRYFSFQLVDFYTFNFDYIGTRIGDINGGNFVIVGPSYEGPIADLVAEFDRVIRCETEFFFSITRTQLLNDTDLTTVQAIQDQFDVLGLKEFRTGASLPRENDPVWPEPKRGEAGETLEIFEIVNFMLQFCPIDASEVELMERFATIGVGPGLPFDASELSAEMRQAFDTGIAQAWDECNAVLAEVSAGTKSSRDLFGTREFLDGNYLYRFAGAKMGIYGNSEAEAYYPAYSADINGAYLTGANDQRYTLTVPKEGLPADAFASITMYDKATQLLVRNVIGRYLVNTAMLDQFKQNQDGSVTIYIQHRSPGADLIDNWLPAPNAPFYMAMRLYIPDLATIDDTDWQPPEVIPAQEVPAVAGHRRATEHPRHARR